MTNSLKTYLDKRLKEESTFEKGNFITTGPVITISREVGCDGIKFAKKLALQLNNQKMQSVWKVLSKEIFFESAKELDLAPEKVRQTFKKTDRYTFEQILKAFGDKRYKSETKITNTVREVVHGLAVDGYNIIVGRASHIIAQDIQKALHIRLTAPLDYRINTIINNNSLSRIDALKFIDKVESERIAFRSALHENSLHEELFDITINRASFNDAQAIELIINAIKQKQMLVNFKPKMEFF